MVGRKAALRVLFALSLILAACAQPPTAPPGIVFPTHPGDAGAYPAALLEGGSR
jgi:hypothetical protein